MQYTIEQASGLGGVLRAVQKWRPNHRAGKEATDD